MSITANSEYNLECIAWVDYLADKYDVHVTAADLSIILARLDTGTHPEFEATMRYITALERVDTVAHGRNLRDIGTRHTQRMRAIEDELKRNRRAITDKRARLTNQLHLDLEQCQTQIERASVYSRYQDMFNENTMLYNDLDSAATQLKNQETQQYHAELDAEDDHYMGLQEHWRSWKDAASRMFTLGLVIPQEED